MRHTTSQGDTSPPKLTNSDDEPAAPVVELSDQQLEFAGRIAESRNRSYASINGGRVCGELTSQSAHEVGVVGELAVAELYGLSLDERIYERGDRGYDFKWNHCKIDVKTTKTESLDRPDLILPPGDLSSAHIYVLAHWRGNHVRFHGLAYRCQVQVQEPVVFPADRENIVIPPENLHRVPASSPPRCPACELRTGFEEDD